MATKKKIEKATPQESKESPTAIEELAVEELSGEEQLLNVGRDKGYVTYDDILAAFPDAEKNLEQMEEVFAALSDAGIQVIPTEDEAADQMAYDDDDDEDELNEHNN